MSKPEHGKVRGDVLDTVVASETPEGILLELRPAGLTPRYYAFIVDWIIRLAVIDVVATVTGFMQQIDAQVIDYAVRLTRATRDYPGLAFGASSRGALALVRGGRAAALLEDRNYVTPDDIKRVALPALRHRVALTPDALLEGRKTDELLTDVIDTVAAPRV